MGIKGASSRDLRTTREPRSALESRDREPKIARGRPPYADTSRAEALLAEIHQKKQLVAETFIDIGLALVELDRKKLWSVLGYSSLSHMLRARGVMGRSQAWKLMAVVRSLPRRDALALGPEKAYALIRYASTPAVNERPSDIVARGLVVRGRRRPIADVTARELVQKARRASKRSHETGPERDANRAAEHARRVLAKRGAEATVSVLKIGGDFVCDVRIPANQIAKALG
jgi:hypothetical protein